jgi:DNA-binding MarR family transcriptional regulator
MLIRQKPTLTEISRRLGRSPSTVKQHLDELKAMGQIRHVEAEHLSRRKYYESIPFGSSEASRNIPAGASDFRMVRKVMSKGILR